MRNCVLVLWLLLGAACVWVADAGMLALVRPELAARLIPENEAQKVWIRFINTGKRNLWIAAGEIEYFVFAPDGASGEYAVHVRHVANPGNRDGVLLPPGEDVDVGDAYPLLRDLPDDAKSLSVVYAAPAASGWGVVRSPQLPLERSVK